MMINDELKERVENLLKKYAKDEDSLRVAKLVANKSIEPNHLYEDLGLKDREEMALFMAKHFPNLAILKPKPTRWKKFIFDTIGSIAPACKGCPDEDICGKESVKLACD